MSKKNLDELGVSAFLESMGMMLQSGITTTEAVELLMQESEAQGLLQQVLSKMHESLENGSNLSEAMKECGSFPEYAVAMMEAADDAGKTEATCFKLSKYYEKLKYVRTKLQSAVVYPAGMILMIIIVLVVMITIALPMFSGVYSSLVGTLVASTHRYISASYVITGVILAILVLAAIALIGGYQLFNHGKKSLVLNVLMKFGFGRKIITEMGMLRFSSALQIYLAAGEMQDTAVEKSLKMVDCEPVEKKIRECMALMLEGHNISEAAYRVNLFEPVYGRMLLAGERSGQLEEVMGRLTQLLEEDVDLEVARVLSIVDPVLSGVLIVTVGVSLLSVILPLVGIMNSLG